MEQRLKKDIYLQVEEKKGEMFFNFKLKKLINCVVCIDGINKVVKGSPRIVYRIRNKTYGSEIYFQFWINPLKDKEEYEANTPWENVEYYLKEKEGIDLLETALEFIKQIKPKEEQNGTNKNK